MEQVTLKYVGPPGRVKSLNWSYIKCTFNDKNEAVVDLKAADKLIAECPKDFIKVAPSFIEMEMPEVEKPVILGHKLYKTLRGANMAILRSAKYSKETHEAVPVGDEFAIFKIYKDPENRA